MMEKKSVKRDEGIKEFCQVLIDKWMESGVDTYDKVIEDIKTRMRGDGLEIYVNCFRQLEGKGYPIKTAMQLVCEVTTEKMHENSRIQRQAQATIRPAWVNAEEEPLNPCYRFGCTHFILCKDFKGNTDTRNLCVGFIGNANQASHADYDIDRAAVEELFSPMEA
jgi:hypothetical protein